MLFNNSNEKSNKRLSGISLFLCVMLITGMLFSCFFIAAESGHHCQSEDCPICQMVVVCENFLNHVGVGLSICAAAVFAVLFLSKTDLIFTCDLKTPTLVSQKVRLND